MKISLKKIIFDFEPYFKEYFRNRKYFVCLYGSHLTNKANVHSDIDIFIALPKYTKTDLKIIKKFIINYHIKNKLELDNEVPYANKLLITYSDLDKAVKLGGLSIENGKLIVPPIIKTKKFLSSKKVKLRLAFNALTSPHKFFGTDLDQYFKMKEFAESNLFYLSKTFTIKKKLSINNLVETLIKGADGETGELYLGYKSHPLVLKYLNNIIKIENQRSVK